MQSDNRTDNTLMTFGEHLEVLRRMLFRVMAIVGVLMVAVFCVREPVFTFILAPSRPGFLPFFEGEEVQLIATELGSQFMAHLSVSLSLGILLASPYILYELFRFVLPALYERERRLSLPLLLVSYALFVCGLLLSYYILFPVCFHFLATYRVSGSVVTMVTLDSYLSTFTTLTLLLGLVFQLPVVAFILARLGLISSSVLSRYRRQAVLVIAITSAVITPPDALSLVLVCLPLYLLYEVSILVVRLSYCKK